MTFFNGAWISIILVNSEQYLETRSFTSMEISVLGPSESQMSDLSRSMSIDLILREDKWAMIFAVMNAIFTIAERSLKNSGLQRGLNP